MHATIDPKNVCAVVLAGGRATRMGGVDKGLQLLHGQPLVQHAVLRLQRQTLGAPGLIAINANRNLADYAPWGQPVWPDTLGDFAGPLAGFQTALQHAQEHIASLVPSAPFEYLLTVPCDSPRFPLDLLARLAAGLTQPHATIAMAAAPEADRQGVLRLRAQPVFCLMRVTLLPDLRAYMAEGGRKIHTWTDLHQAVEVPFDTSTDDPHAFFNTNTPEQLNQLERT